MASPNLRAHTDPTDPAELTPEQRFDELAALLAAGARRLAKLRSAVAQLPPESAANGLDVPREQSVYGPVELTHAESEKGLTDEQQ